MDFFQPSSLKVVLLVTYYDQSINLIKVLLNVNKAINYTDKAYFIGA